MLPPSIAFGQLLINGRLIRRRGAPLSLLMTPSAMFVFADSDASIIRVSKLESLLDSPLIQGLSAWEIVR